jgi:hypothetical protein
MGLLEMIDLGNVFCRMREFKTNALAMVAGREATAFDHGHLVRCIGMGRIMRDRVNA